MAATYDPTPTEIQAACEQIREGWSEAETLKRTRSDQRPRAWLLPGARAIGQCLFDPVGE